MSVLRRGAELASAISNIETWHVEAHQFRILAKPAGGKPTPEGLHRDGVDFVLIVLIQSENVMHGATCIADSDGRELHRNVMSKYGDAIFLDDRAVLHGVETIFPARLGKTAFRDSLVITYHRDIDDR